MRVLKIGLTLINLHFGYASSDTSRAFNYHHRDRPAYGVLRRRLWPREVTKSACSCLFSRKFEIIVLSRTRSMVRRGNYYDDGRFVHELLFVFSVISCASEFIIAAVWHLKSGKYSSADRALFQVGVCTKAGWHISSVRDDTDSVLSRKLVRHPYGLRIIRLH